MMELEDILLAATTVNSQRYYLYAVGTKLKSRYYNSKEAALEDMHNYCYKYGIHIECTEDDVNSQKFSDHNGVKFYLNRVF